MLKKIFLLATLFIGCLSFAQTPIFSEDFDEISIPNNESADFPDGWSIYDLDGNTANSEISFVDDAWVVHNFSDLGNVMVSTSYFQQPGQADAWAVTPQISIPENGAALTFSAMVGDPDFSDSYEILVSTTGNTPDDFDTPIFSEAEPPSEMTQVTLNLSDYAGQDIYIAFRNNGFDGYLLMFDDIQVNEISETDLAVTHIDIDDIINTGETDIKATLTNKGANTISSFDVSWSVDGGEEHVQTVNNADLESFDDYIVVHDDSWDAPSGLHDLKVEVSNINGDGDDDAPGNNSLTKEINVASNTVQRIPLFEEFTSSTCYPCYLYNGQVFTPFFDSLDDDEFSLVKYPVSFPGAGDPYWTQEVDYRRVYYGVNEAPTVLVDGEGTYYDIPGITENFIAAKNVPSYFDMEVEAEMNEGQISGTVDISPYLSGNYTVYIAVVERETTGNVSTNGETKFEQVLMKMLPDANGTNMDFVADEDKSISFGPFDMSSTFVEELDDIQVVAFIEDDETQTPMQSANTGNTLGIKKQNLDLVKIYPNPAENTLTVSTKKPIDLVITDLLGNQVFSQKSVDSGDQLNISSLASGVYFVSLKDEISVTTRKLIVQ